MASETRDDSSQAELREARLEITRLRAEAARLARHTDDMRRLLRAERMQSAQYAEQVRELRRSASWRITRPIRSLKRRLAQRGAR